MSMQPTSGAGLYVRLRRGAATLSRLLCQFEPASGAAAGVYEPAATFGPVTAFFDTGFVLSFSALFCFDLGSWASTFTSSWAPWS